MKAIVLAVAALLLALTGATACSSAANPTPTPSPAPTSTATSSASQPAPTKEATIQQWSSPPPMTIDKSKTYTATLETTDGNIVIHLLASEDPITVNNFVFLSRQGFYNGVKFHRIVKGFMIQTGDPTGTGAGGPGYKFKDEPVTRPYDRGTVAMANSGPNTNGSQFFIMQQAVPLAPNYTIFGEVTQGLDVVDKIANTPVEANPAMGGEVSKPTQDVLINKVTITES